MITHAEHMVEGARLRVPLKRWMHRNGYAVPDRLSGMSETTYTAEIEKATRFYDGDPEQIRRETPTT